MLNLAIRAIFGILSIVTSIIGLIFIVRGYNYPDKEYKGLLSHESVSAVQVTQIYTEATHIVVVGIGIVSFAVFIAVIGILLCSNWPIRNVTPDNSVEVSVEPESAEAENPDRAEDLASTEQHEQKITVDFLKR